MSPRHAPQPIKQAYFLQDDGSSTALTIQLPVFQAHVCRETENFYKSAHVRHKLLFNIHFLCATEHCSSIIYFQHELPPTKIAHFAFKAGNLLNMYCY